MNTPSRRIALLLGSPFGGLTGIQADIDRIDASLASRDFERRLCTGADATRETIIRELERLRDEAGPEDAIVVYYAGHGGRAHLRDAEGTDSRSPHNFLVPIDYEFPLDHAKDAGSQSGAEDCRGVADFELTLFFHELSRKTRNVTVIFDCCHSSTMVRGDEQEALFEDVPEARPRERVRKLGGARLYRMPLDMAYRYEEYLRRKDELDGDSNPHVVRIVATAAGSSAFEALNGTQSEGYLTRELCQVLDQSLHVRISWDVIIRRVREQIFAARRSTTQRPELEGPRDRLPFSLEHEADVVDRSTLAHRSDGTTFVRMGRLHGLHPHDRLDVLGASNATIARADIEEVFDDTARVTLRSSAHAHDGQRTGSTNAGPRPHGTVVSVSSYERRCSVWIDPTTPLHGWLRTRVAAQMRLRLVDEAAGADFRVHADGHQLQAQGPSWFHRLPRPADPVAATALVDDLDDVARGMILQESLALPDSLTKLDWDVEMLVSPSGQDPRPLREGERLPSKTRLHFDVRHSDRGASSLYVNVLDRGVSGRLSLQNPSQPAGVQVRAPEGKGSITVRVPGLRATIVLFWPADVPTDGPLPEEFIVIASRRPLDLRDMMMLDPGIRARRSTPDYRSSDPIAQAHPDRELGRPLPIAVRRFPFHLSP